MASIPPKKGPRMATSCKPETPEQIKAQREAAQLRTFAEKAERIIDEARSKMAPEDRERADRNVNATLDAASASVKQSRRRA